MKKPIKIPRPWSVEECEAYAKQLRDKSRASTAEHAAQAIDYLLERLELRERLARDDIIRMAREAGAYPAANTDRALLLLSESHLERFAALVAAHEREACAELVWPTEQVKVWSEEELTAMTGAFNRAQEKRGWYETIMAVGAAALKHRAAAIRARGEKK